MNTKNKQFIRWLFDRLQNKHHEDLSVIQELGEFIASNIIFPKKLEISKIDRVCKQFYPDFDIERTSGLDIGFSEAERNHMRMMVVESIKELSKQQ